MMKLTKFTLDHPRMVIVSVILLSIVFALFIPRLKIDSNVESMIPEDDPVIQELDQAEEEFGSQDLYMISIGADNIYHPETLKKIDHITTELENVSGIEEVITPLNIQEIKSSLWGIEIQPLTEKLPQTAEEIGKFKNAVFDSNILDKLISSDGSKVILLLKPEPIEDSLKRKELTQNVEKIVEKYRNPEKIYLVGGDYASYYMEKTMIRNLILLVPLVILILVSVLYWSFKSLRGVILPLLTVLISVIWSLGIMGLLGIPLNIVTFIMPIILIAVGSAGGIHIINKNNRELAHHSSKRQALEATMAEMNKPVIMAAITTTGGFLALLSSVVVPIKFFGVITGIGVIVAMFFSLLFIPAALMTQKLPSKIANKTDEQKKWLAKWLTQLGHLAAKKDKVFVIIAVVVLCISTLGIFKLTVESNSMKYFEEDSSVIQGINAVTDLTGGIFKVSLLFDTGIRDGVKEPEILQELFKTQEFLESLPTVSNATSIVDVVRELNQAMNNGEEECYSIPESRQMVAQELLLFTMQGGSGLDSMVNYDFSKAMVSATMSDLSSEDMLTVIKNIENYVEENYSNYEDISVKVVGKPKILIRIMDSFIKSQIVSLITSTIAVGIIVMVIMGSWMAGLISILPVLVTVGINFGLMGLMGIPLDAASSMVASIAIGIGIDYSIHYLSKYRHEIESGKSKEEAIVETSKTSGRGIFFNAITLIFGFIMLSFSDFVIIKTFGSLIALTMFISSIASLTLIPSILHLLPKKLLLRNKEGICYEVEYEN